MESSLKKILRALSLELRHTLEGTYTEDGIWNPGDLERRLNQIGIWREREVKPISEMPNLSPEDLKARELIDAYLALRSDAGVSQSDAVAEFIRESAYSWANRLFALRCMEARGIIDPVILQEEVYHGRSMVHDRFAQMNPMQCSNEDDGLFAMLSEEFRERSKELPDLFAPDSPAVALRPSVVALKHCIALLSGSVPANGGPATDEVFTAPDAFGWAYQYWNAEEKNRVFEMVRTKKGAKIEGSDIIPATQLYTEPYMVKFLVQNSLGATWMMMHPESKLSSTWEYYVKDADRTPNEKKPVAEITFLDPACGSGHFLIEAFDLLYTMYKEEGQLKEPAVICRSILNNNLFGIDIDERAVQITKAVLWMKAAETVFTETKQQLTGDGLSEFHDHIIATNIRLPNSKDHLDAFLKNHPEDTPLRPALLTVFEGLQNVHELGSLVQIEEPVETELKVLKEQAIQQRFDPDTGKIVGKVDFSSWKQQVLKRLKAHFQDEAEKALPTEMFFSQSAVKGLALFDLLARRYDVVAANPPYMGNKGLNKILKSYLELHYTAGKKDLFASFIIRNFQLSEKNGKIAMVTQNSWLFQSVYSILRYNKERNSFSVLKDSTIEAIVNIGPGGFEEISGEIVNTVLFIGSKSLPKNNHLIYSIRLNTIKGKANKNNYLLSEINKKTQEYTTFPNQFNFTLIPNSPIILHITNDFLNMLISYKQLKSVAEIKAGISTSENNRFVKFFWEVFDNNRWCKYSKGGGYSRWKGFDHYVVEWYKEGTRIKSRIDPETGKPFSNIWMLKRAEKEFFFKPGLTYSPISGGSLGVRILDESIFDVKGASIFLNSKNFTRYQLIGYLNTHLSSYLSRIVCQGIELHVGYLSNLPIPTKITEDLEKIVTVIIELKNILMQNTITERPYNRKKNSVLEILRISAILHLIEGFNESVFSECIHLSKESRELVKDETGLLSTDFPLLVDYDIFPEISTISINIPKEVYDYFNSQERQDLSQDELNRLRKVLKRQFEAGPDKGIIIENEDGIDSDESVIRTCIPIPPDTFLEELSQKLQIHPISIYWLLKEGIEKEGWRGIPEERRYTEDLFTVMVLRLLGYRWPKQIEAGEPVPEWADPDGIIPITSGLTHPTLIQEVRDRIAADFPDGKVHEIEKEFEEVVGMSLERWLAGEFFKHHISQFKKRPIAWQLSSSPTGTVTKKGKGRKSRIEPAFSCLVYYHKIDADILHKIRTQYVGDLINRYVTELRALDGRKELTEDQETRKVQLNNWIAELKDFSDTLQNVADTGFDSATLREIIKKEPLDKWASHDGKSPLPKSGEDYYAQEKRYNPDINDGVRVNVAPLQKAGLLAAEVIAKKDVEKAIADRAEWRADERRWCREEKLPKCGWWE